MGFKYQNETRPGFYDIHSPLVPSQTEMIVLLEKAQRVNQANRLWVNSDCGLKAGIRRTFLKVW